MILHAFSEINMFQTIANSFCWTGTLEKLMFLSSSFYGTQPVNLSLHAWSVYSFMIPYGRYAMIFKFFFHFSNIKPLWIYRSLNVSWEHPTLKQRFMYFTSRRHPKNNVTLISLTVQRIFVFVERKLCSKTNNSLESNII